MKKIILLLCILLLTSCGQTFQEKQEIKKECDLLGGKIFFTDIGGIICRNKNYKTY